MERGERFLWSPSLERGHTLGKDSSVDLFHLGHDIFDCFSHQGREGTVFRPVYGISETLDEERRQRDRHLLFLGRGSWLYRLVPPIENEVIDGTLVFLHVCIGRIRM